VTCELVIVGAGGFARETASALRSIPGWRLRGFLDDDPAKHGTVHCGAPVLGGVSMLDDLPETVSVVVCVGSPRDFRVRERLVRRLDLPGQRYATVVHPTAQVGAGCLIGPGSVVLAHTVLTADVTVGAHVAVMPQVVLTHDDIVEDYVTIASGVRLGGTTRVGRGAYLGAGSLVREGTSVGAWSLVGMGSVVLDDVPSGEVWVGNPARFLRRSQMDRSEVSW
jgi:sugar O-acyltransferase (sialic acid O-acetyltransferase NeuD family)